MHISVGGILDTFEHPSQERYPGQQIHVIEIEGDAYLVPFVESDNEAFAGIATAVANTDKNLANAGELFESYLGAVFVKNADVWPRRSLEEVCDKITVGHVGSTAKRYRPTGIPLLRSQNIRPFRVDLDKEEVA